MGKLTDMKVKNAKPGIHGDGAGLYLRVKPSGAKSWVLRVQFDKMRKDIGLGGYPADLSLSEAREKAFNLRKLARQGGDALAVRKRERLRSEATAELAIPTFTEALERAHADLSKGMTPKSAALFKASLERHVVPILGSKPVDQIGRTDVIAALAPTWTDKPETSKKLHAHLAKVLNFAKAHGWRAEGSPTTAELKAGLPQRPKGGNFAAMPYKDVPAFFADQLGKEPAAGRLALLFTVATAARSGEVRAARWDQIDLEAREWIRPAAMMKAGLKHTVTLNDAAIGVLERARELFGAKGLVFPGARDAQLSDMSLSKLMRSAARTETVHGFRSTFRDWAAERMPTVPAMVAEMALAHSVGNATTQAYLRSDLRDQRRTLMDAWSRFIAPASSDNVVEFARTG